jgi:hypothetical protein
VELAGLPNSSRLDGRSLVPLLKDCNAPWDFPALSAYQSNMSVRTDGYRLIRYKDGTTELYDEAKDPHEWKNQANNREYAEIRRKLDALLPPQAAMAPSVDEKRGADQKSKKKNQAPARRSVSADEVIRMHNLFIKLRSSATSFEGAMIDAQRNVTGNTAGNQVQGLVRRLA